ncbi:MAG: MurR/RpiR family transcriptional regulator [Pseudomonadota bacterium]
MNETTVPNSRETALERLAEAVPQVSPQLRLAAEYLLENPDQVGFASVREVAAAAAVKPNTLVRLARALGYEGYEDLRRPFREALVQGSVSFPDRARWLQSLSKSGQQGALYAQMAESLLGNLESLFTDYRAEDLQRTAARVVAARVTYVLGVGVSYGPVHSFAYLARMALDSVVAVPRDGSLPLDDLAKAGPDDLLIAMTFQPYRREVVEAVAKAEAQGVPVIAITDRLSAPIAPGAAERFILSVETPEPFTSTLAVTAFLETLFANVVAEAGEAAVESIERFHRQRTDLGIYWGEEER